MMTGKVKQAFKLVDTENVIAGVHVINDESSPSKERAISNDDTPRVKEIIFESKMAK